MTHIPRKLQTNSICLTVDEKIITSVENDFGILPEAIGKDYTTILWSIEFACAKGFHVLACRINDCHDIKVVTTRHEGNKIYIDLVEAKLERLNWFEQQYYPPARYRTYDELKSEQSCICPSEKYKDRLFLGGSSARGTAGFWQDYWLEKFGGPGEYDIDDDCVVVIVRDGRDEEVTKKKDKKLDKRESNPRHWSVERYGYGNMFFGRFYDMAPREGGVISDSWKMLRVPSLLTRKNMYKVADQ